MRARVVVDAGICGFRTNISAGSEDGRNVLFKIASGCANVKRYGTALAAEKEVDSYAEMGDGVQGRIFGAADAAVSGCCTGCVVPSGVFKAMQLAAGLALPKDVTLSLSTSPPA